MKKMKHDVTIMIVPEWEVAERLLKLPEPGLVVNDDLNVEIILTRV